VGDGLPDVVERMATHVGPRDLELSNNDGVDDDEHDERQDEEDGRVEDVEVEDVVVGRRTHLRQLFVRHCVVAFALVYHVVLKNSRNVEQHRQHVDDSHLQRPHHHHVACPMVDVAVPTSLLHACRF